MVDRSERPFKEDPDGLDIASSQGISWIRARARRVRWRSRALERPSGVRGGFQARGLCRCILTGSQRGGFQARGLSRFIPAGNQRGGLWTGGLGRFISAGSQRGGLWAGGQRRCLVTTVSCGWQCRG